MCIPVATPMDVWFIPDPASYKLSTLFYKVQQVLPCDSVIRLPSCDFDGETIITSLKAEPRMVRLLKNFGINLQ